MTYIHVYVCLLPSAEPPALWDKPPHSLGCLSGPQVSSPTFPPGCGTSEWKTFDSTESVTKSVSRQWLTPQMLQLLTFEMTTDLYFCCCKEQKSLFDMENKSGFSIHVEICPWLQNPNTNNTYLLTHKPHNFHIICLILPCLVQLSRILVTSVFSS